MNAILKPKYHKSNVREGDMSYDEFDPKRTGDQNRKMWPMLTDISRQKPWPHTKGGEWVIGIMPPMSWKAVITAAFEQETQMAQGIGGGTVMVGASTSNYGIRKFSEFIEFLYAQGAEWNIAWSEKSQKNFAEVREIAKKYGKKREEQRMAA